jgi:hypothetical protein
MVSGTWRRIEERYWTQGWSSGNVVASYVGWGILAIGAFVWWFLRPDVGPGWLVFLPAAVFSAFHLVPATALHRREQGTLDAKREN